MFNLNFMAIMKMGTMYHMHISHVHMTSYHIVVMFYTKLKASTLSTPSSRWQITMLN